ncbi:Luciferase family oxidoreductase group 1, flavin-dependent oxidoreductases [Thermobacillus xylanilyticus]|uniref:Luciferase family oxidoreductase group 1, flavin-dependent oxidoreductases n=1 Tax=Thermobacillus xylanilyticus TaxID=76633 RepID=A0ABN7S9P7_THEXY|nr:LLM class flavin-dependent oxidoreductase [Thermobacillus xylanilyticus]CAG5092275.1 Luciferase family oxidoreductase group 1, flavin-dependent oxidoreductases [Thermobacillus xylanilyticus]
MTIKLSILDQSPIHPGETADEALAHTVELAGLADRHGFVRFWVSEHHDTEHLAGSSPETLIPYLLARTERIRVGSGGIMLQHYNPYKVAENFHVLAALAPGRVDLGVGRGPGGLPRSTRALQRYLAEQPDYRDKVLELAGYVGGRPLPEDHPLAGLRAIPVPGVPPEIWLLGTTVRSAELAAELGLPYVFSLFIGGDEDEAVEAVRIYKQRFRPAPSGSGRAEAIIALAAIAADTDEEARSLVPTHRIVKVRLANGQTVTVGSVEQAQDYGRQAGIPYTIEEKEPVVYAGSKEHVLAKLLEMREATGVEEFMITTNIKPFEKRLRSFVLLHEALKEAGQVAT